MITSKITAENLNTPIRGKHGDRARRSLTHWKPWDRFKPCVVESSTKVAIVERENEDGSVPFHYSSNQLDFDTHRWVSMPDVAKVETKTTKKPGNRANKLPPTLNQGPIYSMYDVCSGKLIPLRKKADPDRAQTIGFDEDGCVRIRISDPVTNRKNKHTVDPDAFDKPSGPMLSKAKSILGMFGKRADTLPSICDNSEYVLVSIKLDKIPCSKFYQATCKCRNATAKLSKTIIIPRIRNKVQAQARLTAVHGISK